MSFEILLILCAIVLLVPYILNKLLGVDKEFRKEIRRILWKSRKWEFLVPLIACLVLLIVSLIFWGFETLTSPAGKYMLKSVNGISAEAYLDKVLSDSASNMSREEMLSFWGIDSMDEYSIIELKNNHSASFTFVVTDGQQQRRETMHTRWSQNKDQIIFHGDEAPAYLTLDGKELTWIVNPSSTFVYEKK